VAGKAANELVAFRAQFLCLPVSAGSAFGFSGGVQATADQHRIADAACRAQGGSG
jgi:hypothetical protein